jgi:hypothetical protein
MGVLLQGFFKTAEAQAVPAPSDGDPTILWWWDNLTTRANALGRAGRCVATLPANGFLVVRTKAATFAVGKFFDGTPPSTDSSPLSSAPHSCV